MGDRKDIQPVKTPFHQSQRFCSRMWRGPKGELADQVHLEKTRQHALIFPPV